MKLAQDRVLTEDRSTYEDIVEQSLDCVCVHDLAGMILSANPAFVKAVHATKEADLIGANLAGILAAEVVDQLPAYLVTIREQGKAEGRMRVHTGDGEVRVFEYRNVLQQSKAGMVVYSMARDVTDVLRSTKRLAQSEQRFRTLFERNLAAVLITTLDGAFVDVNETTVRLLHAPSRAALLETNINDYYADAETRTTMMETLRVHSEVKMREIAVKRWDGTLTWAVINCAMADFGPPHGQVILTTALDISARKQVEDDVAGQLRRTEHDYRSLFEHARDPILVLDPETEWVLDANSAACTTYGLSKEELLARSMHDFSLPAAPDRAPAVLNAGGKFIEFETVQFKADGSRMEVEVSAGVMKYRHRPAILSINRDVTEKRRIELERRNAYSRVTAVASEWTATFDAVPNPIIVADANLNISRANRAAATLLNWDAAAIAGVSLDQLEGEPWYTIGALCRRDVDISVEVVGSANERIWDLSLSVQRDSAMPQSRYIIILRDVTATHELQKSLLRVETMSAMGSLVAGVLHEVRNPLFSISATVDVLEARSIETASAKYIERLRNDVGRLRKIMSDLLEYGRPHVLNLQETPLRAILSSAAAGCLPLLDAANVTIEIDPTAMRICADADRLRQVFHNLIENAVQHSPRNGTVRVRVRQEERWSTNWAIVEVEDEGPGFARGDLRHVFEPFFTKRRGGTGLGLSIVRKIVEEHGGSVDVANLPQGGALASVVLRQ